MTAPTPASPTGIGHPLAANPSGMTDSIEVITEPLGGSPLSVAARAGALEEFYPALPGNATAWHRYAMEVAGSTQRDWREALDPAFAATDAALARLDRVRDGKGVVITTGQQPGLFGGPLMTLVKALTARAMADELEAATGVPVAPVFWAATDDADFEEAAVVALAVHGGAEALRHEPTGPLGIRMADMPLGADVLPLGERLRQACASAPHPAALDAALTAYRPGHTVGAAYLALLRAILEPMGIAVLDASHPAVTARATAIMSRAAARAASVATALSERTGAIIKRGYSPQVEEVAGLSLVFTREGGIKRRLSVAEAASAAASGELSSTVLLRPVVERCILPTATYIGGPGEFAYFAQVSAVADALDAPSPRVMPRWSATIVEPRISRLMHELHITRADVASRQAEARIAERHLPPAVSSAVQELKSALARGAESLGAAAEGLVDRRVIVGLEAALSHRLARGERRLLAAVKRRERADMERLGTVRGSLLPFGRRQERTLSYVPFLARYGDELVTRMIDAARAHARGFVEGGVAADKDRPPVPQPG